MIVTLVFCTTDELKIVQRELETCLDPLRGLKQLRQLPEEFGQVVCMVMMLKGQSQDATSWELARQALTYPQQLIDGMQDIAIAVCNCTINPNGFQAAQPIVKSWMAEAECGPVDSYRCLHDQAHLTHVTDATVTAVRTMFVTKIEQYLIQTTGKNKGLTPAKRHGLTTALPVLLCRLAWFVPRLCGSCPPAN